VIEHRIPIDAQSDLLRLLEQAHQLLLGSPLGRHGALLVELAQVIEVVDIVAVAAGARRFAARWDPHVVDTYGLEAVDGVSEALPVLVVVGDVPLEGLQHGAVGGGGLLVSSHDGSSIEEEGRKWVEEDYGSGRPQADEAGFIVNWVASRGAAA
jgi:hypothetical protein